MVTVSDALLLTAAQGDHLSRAGLLEEDQALVRRIAAHLPLLADLTLADVGLLVRAGNEVMQVAQARPTPVPSLYSQPQGARVLSRDEVPDVYALLFENARRTHVRSAIVRGAPVLQEVFPVFNGRGETVAAVRSEMLVIEHERQRKRHVAFRRAVARARELIVSGRLEGGGELGRIGVYDGVMIIGASGRIEYMSAAAEHLYRRLGYADDLVKTQLQELETNEYICFKAMERGVCLEQRVQEHDLVWIKRVVPLAPEKSRGWVSRLSGGESPGAIVLVADVTDELQNERELRIKTAMIQEIHHRVKNNLQNIAALLRLQARRARDPEVADQLRETIGRIISIAVVHEFLSHEETSTINIHEVANRILGEIRTGILGSASPVTLNLEGTRTFTLQAQQATSCALIINELVQNAVEHAFEDREGGTVTVRLQELEDSYAIEISDDGRGLPDGEDALERNGLGLRIVQSLVREDLKGDLQLASDHGFRATISFPKWIARAA